MQTSRNLENDEHLTGVPSNEQPIESSSIKIPKIIYASRTHTQLTQAIKELKGTSYNYMKVGVFASRDQLCIHPDLAFESNENKSEMCKSKTKQRLDPETSTYRCECSFFEKFEALKANETFRADNFENKILDVEDLRTSGREHGYCLFYMSKTLIDDADIVFMPYNYLLDPKIRHFIGVELNDAVIILDEAHNVPQTCEDSASIEFKSSHITEAIREVENVSRFVKVLRETSLNVSETIFRLQILSTKTEMTVDSQRLPSIQPS